MGWLSDKWQTWRVRKHAIADRLWLDVTHRLPALDGLSATERARLRTLATLLLADKAMTGAGGMKLTPEIEVTIAAQACLPILQLGPDWYDDWHEVIVYPDSFVVEHEEVDEAGLVHERRRMLGGEAWGRGPVILSWADARPGAPGHGEGSNVIIHEFAHKLDMRNGQANGMPPLHGGMQREAWTAAFTEAWNRLHERLARHERTRIDPYAAESPAEFFAVLSEHFFVAPWILTDRCPAVYDQLRQFYRQDPLARLRQPA